MGAPEENGKTQFDTLQEEVEELRTFKDSVLRKRSKYSKVSALLVRVWAGPDLSNAFRGWLSHKPNETGLVPVEETADIIAAIIRRVIRVGVIAFCLALIPSILLFWQNIIMTEQNKSLITQIEAQRESTSSQQLTEYFNRLLSGDESQYWAAISFFSTDDSIREDALQRLAYLVSKKHPSNKCEALRALVYILQNDANAVDTSLSQVLLEAQKRPIGLPVRHRAIVENFECKSLDFTNVLVGNTSFTGVDFSNSLFEGSNLSNAHFGYSNLSGSDFTGSFFCTPERPLEQPESFQKSCVTMKGANLEYSLLRPHIVDMNIVFEYNQTTGALINTALSNSIPHVQGICLDAVAAKACYNFHHAAEVLKMNTPLITDLCPLDLAGETIIASEGGCDLN